MNTEQNNAIEAAAKIADGFIGCEEIARRIRALAADPTPVAQPQPEFDSMGIAKHWSVTVEVEGANVLCISSQHLSGVHEVEPYRATIENCAQHLLAFIGSASPVAQPQEGQFERMFMAACVALGSINEALGLDPDDGGAEPILDAIAELKAKAASPVAQDEREAFEQHWYEFYHSGSVKARPDGTYMHTIVQAAWDAWQARAATPAQDKPASPEELLAIARKTGLRTHMHGVDATHAKQMLVNFVASLPAGSQDKQDAVNAINMIKTAESALYWYGATKDGKCLDTARKILAEAIAAMQAQEEKK